jgi:hemolysin III
MSWEWKDRSAQWPSGSGGAAIVPGLGLRTLAQRARPSRLQALGQTWLVPQPATGPPAAGAEVKPRLRGVVHEWAFYATVVAAVPLLTLASGTTGKAAATAFVGGMAIMFGASALWNRLDWTESAGRWMRRIDHSGIYLMAAATYTPWGLLMLDGAWQVAVLALGWAGVAVAIAIRLAWNDAPRWMTAAIALAIGWGSLIGLPGADGAPVAGLVLLLAGGFFYSAGAVVYVTRRPNPAPTVFGFHEVFHVLVVAGVACHYAMVMLFLLQLS